jgi:hypothetical protein
MSSALSPKFVELDLFNFWALKLCCNHGVIDESVLRAIMDHLSNMPIDEQIEKHSNFKDRKFKKIILDDYNRFVFPDKIFAKSKSSAKSNVSAKSKVSGEGEGGGGGGEAALLTTLSENEEMVVEVGVDSADNNLFDIDPILKPQFIHAVVSAANVTDSDFAHIIAINHSDMGNQVVNEDSIHSHNDDDDDDDDDDDNDEEEEDGHSGPVFSNELVEDSYIIEPVKEPKEKLGKEKVVKEKLVKEKVVKEKPVKVPKEKVVKEKPVKEPKEKVVKEPKEKVVKVPKEKVVKEKVVKEKVVKEKVVKEKVVKVPKEKVVKVPKEKVVKEKAVKVPKEKVVKEKAVKGKKKVADGPVVDVEVVDVAAHTVQLAHV